LATLRVWGVHTENFIIIVSVIVIIIIIIISSSSSMSAACAAEDDEAQTMKRDAYAYASFIHHSPQTVRYF